MNPYTQSRLALASVRNRSIVARSLPATDECLYVVPADRIAVVHSISVCNTASTRQTFRLHVATPAETSIAGNAIFYDTPLAAGGALRDITERRLSAGDSIRGRASAVDSISVSIHAVEMPVDL